MTEETQLERVDTPYGVFLSFPDDLITKHLRNFGAHQRNELSMLLAMLRPGDIVLDIGANIGTFAIPIAQRIGPQGHVYAFEADAENHAVLTRNIQLNGLENTITAICALVTRNDGSYQRVSNPGNRGATTFFQNRSADTNSPQTLSIADWYAQQDGIGPLAAIKIDVEGMDVDALLSCEDLVVRMKPLIYIEVAVRSLLKHGYSPCDIECTLKASGYHLFRNLGERNSRNDTYTIGRLPSVGIGGAFFDLLSVHPTSARYPQYAKDEMFSLEWAIKHRIIGEIR